MTRTKRLASLNRFLRPANWWYFVGLPLLGGESGSFAFGAALPGLAAAVACMAFAYGWNSWNDEGVDAYLPWRPRQLATVLGLCVAVALVAGALGGPVPVLAAVVSLAAGWSYSGGPRLKSIPYVNTLANAPIFVPLGLMGGNLGPLSPTRWMLLAVFGLLLLQNQLIHEIQHADEDRSARIGTTLLRLGAVPTGVVSAILGLAAAGILAALEARSLPPWTFLATAAPLGALSVWQLATVRRVAPANAGRLRAVQRWLGLAAGVAAWVLVSVGS